MCWRMIIAILLLGTKIQSVWAYDSTELEKFQELVSFTKKLVNNRITNIHKFVNYNYSIDTYIEEAAYVYDLDPLLLKAIIKHESNFNPYAVSYKGAMGLMQLMPETVKLLKVRDPWDPRENIFAGARYYRMLLDRFHGDHYKALLAYHAGPEAVKKGCIPRESRRYAQKVLRTWKKYQKQGGVL